MTASGVGVGLEGDMDTGSGTELYPNLILFRGNR